MKRYSFMTKIRLLAKWKSSYLAGISGKLPSLGFGAESFRFQMHVVSLLHAGLGMNCCPGYLSKFAPSNPHILACFFPHPWSHTTKTFRCQNSLVLAVCCSPQPEELNATRVPSLPLLPSVYLVVVRSLLVE